MNTIFAGTACTNTMLKDSYVDSKATQTVIYLLLSICWRIIMNIYRSGDYISGKWIEGVFSKVEAYFSANEFMGGLILVHAVEAGVLNFNILIS